LVLGTLLTLATLAWAPTAASAAPVATGTRAGPVGAPVSILAQATAQRQAMAHALAATSCLADPVTIRSTSNGRYVSAELGYGGSSYAMLRARATAVGPWEKFYLCWGDGYSADQWALLAAGNADYVSAELGYTGSSYAMLRARATALGPWEKFRWLTNGNDELLSVQNGRYVSAELGYTGSSYAMLRARATAIGPWEQFTISYV
jgi:hypothetical protein